MYTLNNMLCDPSSSPYRRKIGNQSIIVPWPPVAKPDWSLSQPKRAMMFAEAETPEVKFMEEKCVAPIFPWDESARQYIHIESGVRSPFLRNGDELRDWIAGLNK